MVPLESSARPKSKISCSDTLFYQHRQQMSFIACNYSTVALEILDYYQNCYLTFLAIMS